MLLTLSLSACGTNGPYDLSSDTDRAALKYQIKLALTSNDCAQANTLSTQLYNSAYTDNEARMYYASSQACLVGIRLYPLIDSITTSNFTTPSDIFNTFVRLFPSLVSDNRMNSSWLAQDALQSILLPGITVASVNQFASSTANPSSTSVFDRTLDANTYLVFVSMSVIGTTLNRYGYSAGQTPASLGYGQGQNLPWTTKALVQADTTGAACALVSGFYNMFDGITAIIAQLTGGPSAQLSQILTQLETVIDLAGSLQCQADGNSTAQCTAAALRIRYRGACSEQAAAASFAAGVVQGVNAGW